MLLAQVLVLDISTSFSNGWERNGYYYEQLGFIKLKQMNISVHGLLSKYSKRSSADDSKGDQKVIKSFIF